MKPLEAGTLRSNLGTWAVADRQLPAVAAVMRAVLPPESFDPDFRGQRLHTTYFDTAHYDLRKARLQGDKYLTLRIRRYLQDGEYGRDWEYALSAKTEKEKFRIPLDASPAEFLLAGRGVNPVLLPLLPADLQARLLELIGEEPLGPVVCVHAHRYAVEGQEDRLTLDVGVCTDTGKQLPFHVLEFKSTQKGDPPPDRLAALRLRPIKSSKFLWATSTES